MTNHLRERLGRLERRTEIGVRPDLAKALWAAMRRHREIGEAEYLKTLSPRAQAVICRPPEGKDVNARA